jgi:phosphoserine aminotransferase
MFYGYFCDTMHVTFNPGPSQLYFTVQDHTRKAFRDSIPSLSHRSKAFANIFADTTQGLRELLGIPESFSIFFTGSATEIQERSIQNLVEHQSLHFVNGAFSKRYFEIAQQLKKVPLKIEAPAGHGFLRYTSTDHPEFIALTHNETSTGASLPLTFIHSFRETYPQALIVVDAVSSLPYPDFDYSKIDSVFFSVQKGFGLPAGLGVWAVNERCIAKSESLLAKNLAIGTYHNLPTLLAHSKKYQTPETPNVLGIYLLGKVVEDMLRRGIKSIRSETDYKAAILYQTLKDHSLMHPFVQEHEFQSKTVIVAVCGTETEKMSSRLCDKNMQPGDGYGEFKSQHLRFANFPAHSKEQFEMLVDVLNPVD